MTGVRRGGTPRGFGGRWLTLLLFAAGAGLGALLGFWLWLQLYGPGSFNTPLAGAVIVGGAAVACGLLFARAAPAR